MSQIIKNNCITSWRTIDKMKDSVKAEYNYVIFGTSGFAARHIGPTTAALAPSALDIMSIYT